jgi:hypothetical protein
VAANYAGMRGPPVRISLTFTRSASGGHCWQITACAGEPVNHGHELAVVHGDAASYLCAVQDSARAMLELAELIDGNGRGESGPPAPTGIYSSTRAASQAQIDEASDWLTSPDRCHEKWRLHLQFALGTRSSTGLDEAKPYAAQSIAMARSHFGRFCEWMADQGLTLGTVSSASLYEFLDAITGRVEGQPAARRTRRMYLTEINRVYEHLLQTGVVRANPATELVPYLRRKEPLRSRSICLPPPEFSRALKIELCRVGALSISRANDIQDAALTAILLTCGVTVKEVQDLCIRHFGPPRAGSSARILAPGHRFLRSREIELEPWVGELVQRWSHLRIMNMKRGRPLDVRSICRTCSIDEDTCGRRLQEFGGAKLFARGSKDTSLDQKTILTVARRFCLRLGLPPGGAQMLRNAFLADLLSKEVELEVVLARAGLRSDAQVRALRIIQKGR